MEQSEADIKLDHEVQLLLAKAADNNDLALGNLKTGLVKRSQLPTLLGIAAVFAISVLVATNTYLLSAELLAVVLRFVSEILRSSSILAMSVIGAEFFLYPFSTLILYSALVKWLNSFSQANKLELRQDGLLIGWPSQIKEMLYWDEISSVFLFRPADTMLPEQWLLGFGCSKTRPVAIRMPVASVVGKELLLLLEEKCKWVSIDPDLIELWEPSIVDSHTDLWLKSLSNAPKESELMPLYPGELLGNGRYRIIARIGVGGQGTAYLADDLHENIEIVIKENLFPVFVDPDVRVQAERRFNTEIELLKRLDHPNVVKMRDSFVSQYRGYLVLDFIDGDSLRQLVRKSGAFTEEKVITLASQMLNILQYLHELEPSVVHRDFTPENLILDKSDRLVLIDFNVARQMESTKTATVVGKHAYIPPEQFRADADTRSDIYAFGATLFFLLCAEDPEPISQSFPSMLNKTVSEKLNLIVAKSTAQEAGERYQSATEVLEDLARI